jgi:glycosyltransferase involved in cell wall biosynthesis
MVEVTTPSIPDHRGPVRQLRSLAIVVPFFNEAAGVEAFYHRLRAAVDPLGVACAFVFVDDGSRDETLRLINGLADGDRRITVLSLSRNWGHQMALTAGFDYVGEDVDAVITMDGDLQHPPEVIAKMIRLYESGADVVYGVRRENTGAGPMKQVTSRAFNALLAWSTDVRVVPGAADFRLMSLESVRVVRQMREVHRYLRGMVPWAGFSSAVVVYDQAERHAGTPAYTWRRSLRLAQHGVFSFSVLPLHVITWLGAGFAAIAGVYLTYVAWVAFNGRVVTGWPSVIGVLLIVSAFQFLALSILAQYLGMVFEQAKQRPLYVLKQARQGQRAEAPRSVGTDSPSGLVLSYSDSERRIG